MSEGGESKNKSTLQLCESLGGTGACGSGAHKVGLFPLWLVGGDATTGVAVGIGGAR